MTLLPADCVAVAKEPPPSPDAGLERLLRAFSVLTMLLTIPQVFTIWFHGNATGVSLVSWGAYLCSACLWFVYGLRRGDKTIYIACIGWMLLDAAIVAGVIVHGT